MWRLVSTPCDIYAFVSVRLVNTAPETFGALVLLHRSRCPVHGDASVRAFPGQGGPSGAVRPAPPIRGHKRARAKRPPRRPTRADSATPAVNETARLDFEAGLELPDRNGSQL